MAKNVLGLAAVGGRRGGTLPKALAALSDEARLVAVCDLDEAVLARWEEDYPGIVTYTDYERMLDNPDIDAVFIATPLRLHAGQAISALNRGKHVMSEVTATATLEECWALVEAVEKSGCVYMMAENYCYNRANMMVLHMAQQGVFGEITHAEGAYIHDCRTLMYNSDGSLTWRGRIHQEWNCASYPTHSLGPVAQWLGINRESGDSLDFLVSCASAPRSTHRHFRERFGADHPGANPEYWHHGDSQVTILSTKKGACIVLRVDWSSARPHNMTHYVLQGTTAAYLAPRHGKEDPLIWIEGRSSDSGKGNPQWEPLWTYAAEFEHPYWRDWRSRAEGAGHGGGDFFVLLDFLRAIKEGTRPAVDVYDAVTWSSIIPLSAQSIAGGSIPVAVPDFTRGK
jgi:predicted dehydrogenase